MSNRKAETFCKYSLISISSQEKQKISDFNPAFPFDNHLVGIVI